VFLDVALSEIEAGFPFNQQATGEVLALMCAPSHNRV
jgi:hypothetical protein